MTQSIKKELQARNENDLLTPSEVNAYFVAFTVMGVIISISLFVV